MVPAVSRKQVSGLLVVMAILWFGSSCTVRTTSDLASTTDNMQVWEVNASVGKVFGTYKDYAETHYAGSYCLLGGGRTVKGSLHGPNAELSITHEGNPFYRVALLHFVFETSADSTTVTTWYYDDVWRHNAEEFKKLLPMQVRSSPSNSVHSN